MKVFSGAFCDALAGLRKEMEFRIVKRSDYEGGGSGMKQKILVCAGVGIILLLTACSLPRIVVLDDPLSPEEHLNLGVAYERTGDFEGARKEYEAASRKLPIAYLYLGNVYFQEHEPGEAERYYRKAIEKDPENADAYNNLAWLYYTEEEHLDEAEKLALKAIEIKPSQKDIYEDTLERIRALRRDAK